MKCSSLRYVSAVGSAVVIMCAAHAQEPAIITKARARIGSEALLNGVKSVRYVGTLVATDPKDPAKQQRSAIEIIFQKNDQQRVSATSDKLIETTALDGYEAWTRKQDAANAANWELNLQGPEQIKRLRANTFESLAFFRGLEARGGGIEDQGPATIDGIACQKVAFVHGAKIVFYRYFDLATGRLVFTETENGSTVREQGEIIEAGVRFPKSIVFGTKDAKGEKQTSIITIEKVTVNETYPATLFSVPALSAKK